MKRCCWILLIAIVFGFLAVGVGAQEKTKRMEAVREMEADQAQVPKPGVIGVRPSPMPVEPAPFMKPGAALFSAMLVDEEQVKKTTQSPEVEAGKPQPMPAEPKK